MSSTMDERDDPARIERNGEEIRANMNATLDALGRKLSPGQLIDKSTEFLRDNGGDLAANFARQVRENPVPFALTAVGLVWLIASQSRSHRSSSYYGTDDFTAEDYSTASLTPETPAGASESGSKLSHAKERVQETAQTVRDKLRASRDRIRSSTERVKAGGDAARHRVSSAAHATHSQALRAKDSFATMADEQPLALGAIGIVIGAIIGTALPGTRREDELLGRTRDRTLERARELGSEQYAQLRERAVTAAERAKEAAKDALKGDVRSGEQNVSGTSRDEGAFRGASTPVGRA
ncbi:MAG TPA: DUF3618 domain-containing protein [Steroidobacteraceae bacterium]|nr:DUF3618 domain-containing protein [Steroidobacteraceae bacterium]